MQNSNTVLKSSVKSSSRGHRGAAFAGWLGFSRNLVHGSNVSGTGQGKTDRGSTKTTHSNDRNTEKKTLSRVGSVEIIQQPMGQFPLASCLLALLISQYVVGCQRKSARTEGCQSGTRIMSHRNYQASGKAYKVIYHGLVEQSMRVARATYQFTMEARTS